MIDIKLDTTTNDLVIEDGDLVLVTESEEVAQNVKIHLLTLSGEWELDVGVGMRWFDKIFTLETPDDEKALLIKREIQSVTGVKNITDFTLEVDFANHRLDVSFEATTDFGDILIEVSA